jgi:hypothetical protein
MPSARVLPHHVAVPSGFGPLRPAGPSVKGSIPYRGLRCVMGHSLLTQRVPMIYREAGEENR